MPQQSKHAWFAAWTLCLVLGLTGCQGALRGEPWTIECLTLRGAEHREHSDAIADALRQFDGVATGKVRVHHTLEASTIYYGRYFRRIDREKGLRPIPDKLRDELAMIQELVDDHGRRVFIAARMVREPLPDVGPPEWNLENTDGVYTLQVAAFESTPGQPDYKRAAARYAAQLRKKGYEAYYHHGESASVVTVGTFNRNAVITRDGRPDYSQAVRALQQKETFIYNLTNGDVWHAIVDGKKAPVRSLLVEIPKRGNQFP